MFLNKLSFIILTFYNLPTKTEASKGMPIWVGTMINSSIDRSVSPCEGFYAYACGNYNGQHANNNFYNDIISYVDHQYNSKLLNLFETTSQHMLRQTPDPSQTFVEKTKIYLTACLHADKRNLTKYLTEVKPGLQLNWPILLELEQTNTEMYQWPSNTDFDVWSLLGQLHSYGLNDVLIYQEMVMGREGEISIMLAPCQINNKNTLPDAKVLHVLFLQMGVKSPVKVIHQLKKTHKKLSNIANNLISNNGESLEMTFGDLEIFYPNLNLSSFLSQLLDKEVPADTFILLRNPSYFKYLNDNLWKTFEKHHFTNYLMAKFLYFLAFDGAVEFKNMACIKDLRKKFDLALNFLYHQHLFSTDGHLVTQDIQRLFRAETEMLANYFQSNYLQLSSSQIAFLMDKLVQVRLNVGNLPANASFVNIEDYYATMPPLDKDNYYKNHLALLKFRFAKSLFYIQNQTHFIVTDNKLGSGSGAFYVPSQNMIVLPFASLMQPLYDINYNDLNKFSLLGFILAHELAHAFDTNGLNFDQMGQYSTTSDAVWTNLNFQNSLKCLQHQLATESIDELVADNVAIQVVRKILTVRFKSLLPSEIPSKWQNYFFLLVAQIFCNKNNIKYDDHDRLNEIVMNSEGFSQAFECPQESKMNARHRCRVY